MRSRLFRLLPVPPSVIKQVYNTSKPSFFTGLISGRSWRHKSMGKTLDCITDPIKHMELQKQAQLNINEWAQKKSLPPNSVEVVYKDWGVAALEATKKHGVPYAVLNMANSIFPGGAALEGGNAQEENMWHRSNSALSLLDKNVYLDNDSNTFRYNETTSKLLDANLKMSDGEREVLKKYRGEVDNVVYKVLFNTEPRVCFRGPEIEVLTQYSDDLSSVRSVPDSTLSYSFYPQSDIFPFYEIRSAAPDRSSEAHTIGHEDLQKQTDDLRRRISAQLDTLIIEGQRNVILGAWGCGSFNNDAELVARIYREEIEKRAFFFDHIVFPILKTNARDNYATFDKYLNGMKLKSTNSVDMTLGSNTLDRAYF